MNGYPIIMFIFFIMILISGIYVYTGHDSILARGYYKKESKEYLRFVGRTIILIAFAPLLSALVSLIGDSREIFFLSFAVLIIATILAFYISISVLKRK